MILENNVHKKKKTMNSIKNELLEDTIYASLFIRIIEKIRVPAFKIRFFIELPKILIEI
jgi:hypothetical protein